VTAVSLNRALLATKDFRAGPVDRGGQDVHRDRHDQQWLWKPPRQGRSRDLCEL